MHVCFIYKTAGEKEKKSCAQTLSNFLQQCAGVLTPPFNMQSVSQVPLHCTKNAFADECKNYQFCCTCGV